MTGRVKAAIVVGVLVALAPRVSAEPTVEQMPSAHLWMRSAPGQLQISERLFLIPQGSHVLTEEYWLGLETEKKRLQEQEIRLTAENQSYQDSADEVPWRIIALGVAVGLVTGVYIGTKF